MHLKEGTRVSWLVKGAHPLLRGAGVTIEDERSNGHVLVAVDYMAGEPNPGYYPVIYCPADWLTPADHKPADHKPKKK